MYDEIITLVTREKKIDTFGDISEVTKERDVFAALKSVTQSEFYQAQAVGQKPEIKFALEDYRDYRGEQRIRYRNSEEDITEEYAVMRTYRKGKGIEITCRKGIEG